MSTEPYRSPKELAQALSEHCGRRVSVPYARRLIRDSKVKRIGSAARFGDLVAWWEAHPDYMPRAKQRMSAAAERDFITVL